MFSSTSSKKNKNKNQTLNTDRNNQIVTEKPIDPTIDGLYIRGYRQTYNDNVFLKDQANNTFEPGCKYVDIVYTWVNGSDPINIENRNIYSAEGNKEMLLKESNTDARFRDFGILKYSLRSVRKNASWIRKIFIVTANQIPSWFNTSNNDNVEFIFHEEYYLNKSHLPTFNSNSIEGNFHNLPEKVSNCFLYLNDDIFFKNPVELSDFFDEKYKAHIFQRKQIISSHSQLPGDFVDSLQYTNMVYTNRYLDPIWFRSKRYRSDHGVLIFNKNLLKMAYRDLITLANFTSVNRFRDPKDISTPFAHLQYAKRYSTFQVKPSQNAYFSLNDNNFEVVLNEIRDSSYTYKTVCLNDAFRNPNESVYFKIDSFLNDHFPVPSPYENKY
ncbi:hypothetical protein RB653_003256 [Dictyostelium firmibasis]|uniref:Uncharacterized protein n=1 Tax=Dictyostelium firmibasis TaxID=79012 RepID=A0AAN7YZD5_9MYCE